MKQKLLIIAGPTGVGKTELSIKLAKLLDGEVISADSMQIYKHMDIGSAKVTKEEMNGIKHHMIDVVMPDKSFTVVDYKNMAEKEINDVINRNKLPIIVGGTGLYINSLTCNMNFTEAESDIEYRKYLEDLAIEKGNNYVHSLLKEIDPISYEKIHANNLKRVIRALEVYKVSGKPFSSFNDLETFYNSLLKEIDPISYEKIHANNLKRVIRALEVYKVSGKPFSSFNDLETFYKSQYDIYYYVLTMDRDKLYNRINRRVDKMFDDGLLEECIKLKELGYTTSMQSMQGIGYKEVLYYLDNKISLEEASDMIKQGSRNYAKRQLTWFKKDPRVKFIDKDVYCEEDIISLIIKDLTNN